MPGPISLNTIIGLMNQAANDSQNGARGDLTFLEAPPEEPLATIKTPKSGKDAYEKATSSSKITQNMLPVDPQQQMIKVAGLDEDEQNYLMEAFHVVNSRIS